MNQRFELVGTGGYLPRERITAEQLDERLGLEPGWTLRHTGVAVRHRRAPDENATHMAKHAALAALENARLSVADLDLIIDASACQQQPIPCNAALLNEELGPEARGIASLDVHCSCLSFVAALATVNAFFAAGMHRRALIVSAETPLDGVNWSDPASACLMGEGAAAAVLVRCAQKPAALGYRYETLGEFASACEVPAGGHRIPPFEHSAENAHRYRFFMDGAKLHRIASRSLPALVNGVLEDATASLASLHVVPHQASGPALRLLSRRLGLPEERLHSSLSDHGNLVAAGIPYALHHAITQGRLQRGERVMLLGTAAGYAQAALIFTL